jgi:hypothetical protein
MSYKLGGTYTFLFPTHDSKMKSKNADALPVATVFEDNGDASMYSPTVEQVGGITPITGLYRAIVVVSAANGFEVAKSYNVMVAVTMDTINMLATIGTFVLDAASLDDLNSAITTIDGKVDDIYIDTQRVDGLIEDDGLGNDRLTKKALEEAPTGGAAPTAEDIRIEMDDHSTKLSGIKGDTEDIKEIVENLPTDPEEWNP